MGDGGVVDGRWGCGGREMGGVVDGSWGCGEWKLGVW